jgi:hypothetical protein
MADIDIYTKLTTLPDSLKKEVNDFVDFLKSKSVSKSKKKPKRKPGLAKGLIQIG